MLEDGNANGYVDKAERHGFEQSVPHGRHRVEAEQEGCTEHGCGVSEPFDLLTLDPACSPEPEYQRDRREKYAAEDYKHPGNRGHTKATSPGRPPTPKGFWTGAIPL